MIVFFIILFFSHLQISEFVLGDEILKPDLNDTFFYHIFDFKISDDGIVYVADYKGNSIYAFNKDGSLINKTGRAGRGPGEFRFGPRMIERAGDYVYVNCMHLYLHKYDKYLNYISSEYTIESPIPTLSLRYDNNALFFTLTNSLVENIAAYDLISGTTKKIYLGFELKPGLLSGFDMIPMGDHWLFVWRFQNKFKLYDASFNLVRSFILEGFPEQAAGEIRDIPRIPEEANEHQFKVLQMGTFLPAGSFFDSFVKLSDSEILIQLGTLTGGMDKGIIIDLQGNILQEITLPVIGKILGYSISDSILYMQIGRTDVEVVAYEFYRN